jgi:hypothetical protein
VIDPPLTVEEKFFAWFCVVTVVNNPLEMKDRSVSRA